VLLVLGLVQGKALNYNGKGTSWDVGRQKIRSVFEKHNFTFRWTFAEFQGARELPEFALDQILDAYEQLSLLIGGSEATLLSERSGPAEVAVTQGNGADLEGLSDGSVAHLCMDPPYYDNVMYAELSDFFYVWERHTLGLVVPEFFRMPEADKVNEAIANPARFAGSGKRGKELARSDYEAKMAAIFAECHRVLRDDGIMTVMFTHKTADAWDTLGSAIIAGGFTIETSWPVNTESEYSSHQSGRNAANSTIMLACRKRDGARREPVYLEDIEADIRRAARDAAVSYEAVGIQGVDLLLSTYGPALSVISQRWPVYSSVPGADGRDKVLRPEEALAVARAEVIRLRRGRLVGRAAHIDDLTDFSLMAWDVFGGREFPFDTARLLALAVGGLDLDFLARAKILEKNAGVVRLLEPRERVRRSGDDEPGVHVGASHFGSLIDAVHTVLYVGDVDGMHAAKALMDRSGLTEDDAFLAAVQGLVNAVPRARHKQHWVIREAGLLDTLITAYLPSISLPAEQEVQQVAQASLFETD
jgi:adenine-specific DNA methylase